MIVLVFAAVLFSRDVAPILEKHCVECHRDGEVAPFPLVTYEDARQRAKLIAKVTAERYMPPWKPVHGYGEFAGERRLTAREIATLRQWAAGGAPPGPPRPPVPAAAGEPPRPDLSIRMPAPYQLAAGGPDTYRCFVLPVNTTEGRWVRRVEFVPSNRRIVHHALFFNTMQQDLPPDYACFGTPGFLPASSLGGWSPGNRALEMHEGTAMRLPKGSRVVIQVHFHPTGKNEVEQSRLDLHFAAGAPARRIADVALVSRTIDIAPGERAYKVRDHFTLPVNVHAVGIIPHAHYVCRDVKGWAKLPNGKRVWLLWIKDWDFDWQDRYWYRRPIALPAGTRVEMEFTYDNSAANPRNPNSPPRRVTWGPDSTDEMAGLHIQVIADREEDLPELGKALWGKIMRMVGGRF
jgi:hypothetical protein